MWCAILFHMIIRERESERLRERERERERKKGKKKKKKVTLLTYARTRARDRVLRRCRTWWSFGSDRETCCFVLFAQVSWDYLSHHSISERLHLRGGSEGTRGGQPLKKKKKKKKNLQKIKIKKKKKKKKNKKKKKKKNVKNIYIT